MTLDLDALEKEARHALKWEYGSIPVEENVVLTLIEAARERDGLTAELNEAHHHAAVAEFNLKSERDETNRVHAELTTLRAQLAQAREALERARPWVETGPQGPWRDGVLASIDAVLNTASASTEEGL